MSRPLNPWKLSGYKAGQNVICKVGNAEPGGYAVIIPKDNLPGFLPTQAQLKVGEEILAQFVCVHNNRILLSARFSSSSPSRPVQSVRWEDYLSELDSGSPQPELVPPTLEEVPAPQEEQPPPPPKPFEQSRTLSPMQQFEEEAAFRVWAQNPPRKFHLKRAVDLILPPMQAESMNTFKISDYDLEWLITDLEGGMRTCSVKAMSQDVPSRSAMLIFRGRAVGCAYTSTKWHEPPPTEQSLQLMLNDLTLPNTRVSIYDLPESLTLAMSALFLGYPVKRTDDYEARPYFDYICEWLESKGQTACLSIVLPSSTANCFAYIYKGQFAGAFYVEDQMFTQDKNFIYRLLRNDKHANVEASILPPELTSSAVRFGFSISMARTKRPDILP
jgi:hypothetical protein